MTRKTVVLDWRRENLRRCDVNHTYSPPPPMVVRDGIAGKVTHCTWTCYEGKCSTKGGTVFRSYPAFERHLRKVHGIDIMEKTSELDKKERDAYRKQMDASLKSDREFMKRMGLG